MHVCRCTWMHLYQEEMTTSGVIIRLAIFVIWDRVSHLNYMDLTNYTTLAREQTLSILLSPSSQNCDGRYVCASVSRIYIGALVFELTCLWLQCMHFVNWTISHQSLHLNFVYVNIVKNGIDSILLEIVWPNLSTYVSVCPPIIMNSLHSETDAVLREP